MLIAPGVGERIREEREKLGLSQTDFGVKAGVSRGTQKAYELESSTPDLRYVSALEAIGSDAHYVLTGLRTPRDAQGLSEDEALVLSQYRALPDADKASVARLTTALAALAGRADDKKND
ncbi:helix-turn-helix transcriptional regulator [Pseudomonas sp. PS02288]|uniref:helix-turn-helix domain-containing protein n=1 Tax=Pseudomonas sp. PS02288 TaxID=2991443 RepID=UPI00249B918A|nr:helix-turn-helix transcriptional regulator [Pseudomonas sp. PS02288]